MKGIVWQAATAAQVGLDLATWKTYEVDKGNSRHPAIVSRLAPTSRVIAQHVAGKMG